MAFDLSRAPDHHERGSMWRYARPVLDDSRDRSPLTRPYTPNGLRKSEDPDDD